MTNLPPPPAPRRILLGVTGGIAAYKSCELARLFVKAGSTAHVVMTAHAREFVTPLSFQALTGQPVRDRLFDAAHEAAMGHIELARWADALVIAPATANTLAKLANGLADDLLTTLCLATDRPVFVAPAMNRLMWSHAATQANLAVLRQRGVAVLGPGSGAQACGEIGDGRMWEPAQIFEAVCDALSPSPGSKPLAGLRAVVTAGPTREPVDPVRFITNRSSGKQGYALAMALRDRGAAVTLVTGPTQLPPPEGLRIVTVETAAQMLEASLAAAADAQLFVGAAAVADYRVADVAGQKIKKSADTLSLSLVKNPDILATVRAAHPGLFLVGFAAETEQLEAHARSKLERKKLDLIAANWVGEGRAFDRDDNALSVYWAGGAQEITQADKHQTAAQLADLIVTRYQASRPA